jgi:hypothetical protein
VSCRSETGTTDVVLLLESILRGGNLTTRPQTTAHLTTPAGIVGPQGRARRRKVGINQSVRYPDWDEASPPEPWSRHPPSLSDT